MTGADRTRRLLAALLIAFLPCWLVILADQVGSVKQGPQAYGWALIYSLLLLGLIGVQLMLAKGPVGDFEEPGSLVLSSEPTDQGDKVAAVMRDFYDANRPPTGIEHLIGKRSTSPEIVADELMLGLMQIATAADLQWRRAHGG